MTGIWTFLKLLLGAFNEWAKLKRSRKDIELGEHRARERQEQENEAINTAIDAANPDELSDEDIIRR